MSWIIVNKQAQPASAYLTLFPSTLPYNAMFGRRCWSILTTWPNLDIF